MYPHNFFSLLPPFPRKERAFVAMSFDPRFDTRWANVLVPALKNVSHNGIPLEAFRVDVSKASDAILTEILEGIADSLVVVADITAVQLDDRPVRNANVMYEVGLAHAARLPEEVVLFRSDSYPLDFDVRGVRVHPYNPDADPDGARMVVAQTVVDSLKGLDSKRRASVRAAGEKLTLPAMFMLFEALQNGTVNHPPTSTIRQAVGAIRRTQAISTLLDLGAIQADLIRVTPEMLKEPAPDGETDPAMISYKLTRFGDALIDYVGQQMGFQDETLRPHLEALLSESKADAAE